MTRSTRFLLALACLTAATPAAAQDVPAYWGSLRPGRYGVGFRVVQAVDHTRGYRPRVDYRGVETAGETARPVQLTVWYPAQVAAGDPPLRFGEYLDAAARELGDHADFEAERAYRLAELRGGPLAPFFGGPAPDSAVARIESMPVRAVADAPMLPGPFPVVLHPGVGGALAQSVLFEFLASHGYIVVSTPLLGTGPAWHGRGEWTLEALDEAARDVAYAFAWSRELPAADPARVAVVGMGAQLGMLFEMREMRLAAIALVESPPLPALRQVPGFGFERVRIPILYTGNTEYAPDFSMLDSLRYADRYQLSFRDATHAAFYQFPRIARPEAASEHVQYEAVARYLVAFLDAVLRQDTQPAAFPASDPVALGLPPGYVVLRGRRGLPPAPTEAEFLDLIRSRREQEAVRVYGEVQAREPDHRIFAEAALRTTLRFLMRDHGASAAVPGAELLVHAYPENAAARDLLGSLYLATGRTAEALRETEAALSLLDADPSLTADQRERMRRVLQDRLRTRNRFPVLLLGNMPALHRRMR